MRLRMLRPITRPPTTSRWKPPLSAPPAALASSNARWASSICPSFSTLACAPRRGQHRSLGRHPQWAPSSSGAREQGQRPRPKRPWSATKFIAKTSFPHLRRLSGILSLARLHGRLRPLGVAAKSSPTSRTSCSICGTSFSRDEERKMHQRPGVGVSGNDLRVRLTSRSGSASPPGEGSGQKDRGDAPALRPHYSQPTGASTASPRKFERPL